MFGTLVYTELDKLAGCGAGKKAQKSPLMKTDAVSMVKKALMENPQQITPPGGYQQPKPITPPVGGVVPPAQPITPAEGEKPQPLSSINQPRYKQASLQESTMNMFGVLVNMELQKLAAEAIDPKKVAEMKKKAPKPTGSDVFGVKAPEKPVELPALGVFGKNQ